MMSKYCQKCGGDSYVIETREKPYGVRRRRECEKCGFRWSTIEVMAKWKPMIMKPLGREQIRKLSRWLDRQSKQ